MSSFPASSNPQKSRVLTLGRKARGALSTRLQTARPHGGEPANGFPTASPPEADGQAAQETAAQPLSPTSKSLTAFFHPGVNFAVPAVPATAPPAALPARIPYSEWKGPRPRAVKLSFMMILLAALISLTGGVAASRNPVTDLPPIAFQLELLGIDSGEYAAALQVATLASALVVFGLYLLLSFMIREGRNWARIGGSLLVAGGLYLAIIQDATPQILAGLLAFGGLTLLYRRDCARYFRPRRSQYLGIG